MACKYEDSTCSPDWQCEACVYDWAEAEGRQDVLASFARGTVGILGSVPSNRFGNGGPTYKRIGGGAAIAPSEKQIAFLAKLANQKGVAVPDVSTKSKASSEIERLLALPDVTPVAGAAVEGRWTKVGNDWAVRIAGGSSGATVTVVKGSGERQEVVLDQELASGCWSISRKPAANAETYEPGFYRNVDGKIVKVKATKDGQRVYGNLLTEDGGWEYVKGALKGLTRLTVEEAKEYGHLTGRCCCCGRELTNETSIELGIGPICLAKNF